MRHFPSLAAVRSTYERVAQNYDDRYRSRRRRKRFEAIDGPQLQVSRGATRILELGCGTGRLLRQTTGSLRVGIDIAPSMARKAATTGLVTTVADAHVLPFRDSSFDAVLAGNGVFRYLDYTRAFAEVTRVLVVGGHLGVHQYAARTWGIADFVRAPKREPMHVTHLDELREPAKACGLVPQCTHLWRSVRFPPYALTIPEWFPGNLWSHCTVVFQKQPTD